MDEQILAARLHMLKAQEIQGDGIDNDGDGVIDEPPTFEEKRKTTINPKTQKPAKVETSQTYTNPTEEAASQVQAGRSTASDGTNPTQASIDASATNPYLKARLYALAIDPNHSYTMEQWDIDKIWGGVGQGIQSAARTVGQGVAGAAKGALKVGAEVGGLPTIGRGVQRAVQGWDKGQSATTGGAIIPKEGTLGQKVGGHLADYASGVMGGESVFDPKNATIAGQNARMGIDDKKDMRRREGMQTPSAIQADTMRRNQQAGEQGQMLTNPLSMPAEPAAGAAAPVDPAAAPVDPAAAPVDPAAAPVDPAAAPVDPAAAPVAPPPTNEPNQIQQAAERGFGEAAVSQNIKDEQGATAQSKTSGGLATNPWLGMLTGGLSNIVGAGYNAYQRGQGRQNLSSAQTQQQALMAGRLKSIDHAMIGYWDMQKARRDIRERDTTEAIRIAYE
jgi:hypothetical protein